MKEKIQKIIEERIGQLQADGVWPHFEVPTILVERPRDVAHGNWTSNVGFVLARYVKKSPEAVAQDVVNGCVIENIEVCDVIGGYINFVYTRAFNAQIVKQVLTEGEMYGCSDLYTQKNILVEHSSPNLFKPFHIGHLVNNTVGESVARMMKYSGAHVDVISYPSDVSLGVAKAVWAVMQKDGDFLFDEVRTIHEKMVFAGECYAYGTVQYDEDENVQKEIRQINKQIYASEDTEAYRVYKQGKELNLDYFVDITKRLGSQFDGYIFESEAGAEGKKIVESHTPTIFEESNDAVVYKGEKDGLHTRVFLNAEHLPTYEAKDIGLLSKKFDIYGPDVSLFVTDHEQSEYFKVVLAAAGKIDETWRTNSQHVTHGRLQFAGGKVSSRLGNVPLAEDVLSTIRETVIKKMQESAHSKTQSDDELVDMLAISALKFTILKTSLGKNMIFDEEEALSFEGDSGPYVQYTYARICSVQEKASQIVCDKDVVYVEDTLILERKIALFEDVVEKSIVDVAPHHIVSYLLELAREFNAYYARQQIISDDKGSCTRLNTALAVGHVIKNGLNLLGIKAPQKM